MEAKPSVERNNLELMQNPEPGMTKWAEESTMEKNTWRKHGDRKKVPVVLFGWAYLKGFISFTRGAEQSTGLHLALILVIDVVSDDILCKL